MASQLLIAEDYEIPDASQLVTEDDTPVDNFASEKQQRLLVGCLYSNLTDQPFLSCANVGIYHTVGQPQIVPDVFVSFDVQVPENWWEKQHRCYLVWNFGKPPDVVIEIVSNQVGNELTEKLQIYEHARVSYYVVYDPSHQLGDQTLRLYELRGRRYAELPNQWLEQIGLGLTLWQGEFEERQDTWLRWCDRQGAVLLTGDEQADQERQRADQAQQRADRAEQIQRRAIAQLMTLGMDPDQISATLGLSPQDVEQIASQSAITGRDLGE
ncbi:MAG: Uma2 family endonuclease [Thermosynechococcaceae cyanobacterium]